MKTAKGLEVRIGDTVSLLGDVHSGLWKVEGFDGEGGADLRSKNTGMTLNRHRLNIVKLGG